MNEATETGAVVAAAKAGDEAAFASLVERYRRELHLHCYRMTASFEDAEDLVQETFLRAWRNRASFEGRSTFRAWLYRIATNACLDALAQDARRAPSDPGAALPAPADLPWLQPYPDLLLDGAAPSEGEPDAAAVSKETIELAFLAAIQHLPPRQRAVLILRDVLGWSAKETASLLESSVAAVNSALQRARATLKERLPRRRLEWAAGGDPSEEERALLQRYVEAHERADIAGLAALLRDDALLTMPPQPLWYRGRDAIATLLAESMEPASPDYVGHFRLVPTRANRQPAAANYLRRPGDSEYRPLALDVLRVEEGEVVEIVAFQADLFPAFGLPPTL
ncbi:MAG: sigma-70 family RNA polymerase sigma factor [Gaiellaceae bacterium]